MMKLLLDPEFKGSSIAFTSGASLYYGQLFLTANKARYEWRFEYCYGQTVEAAAYLAWSQPENRRIISEQLTSEKSPLTLTVAPRLADRSIISRPVCKLEILPTHKATLFISSPLWLQFMLGDQIAIELPTMLMSDTWFGSNTRWGEVAYASTTRARLENNEAEVDNFKATTALTIVNDSTEKVSLEKINVPMPELSLYRHQNAYHTSPIHIHIDSSAQARVSIEQSLQKNVKEIGKPRRLQNRSMMSRAVDLILA